MPYKFETKKIKLPVGKDRRVKLTMEQKHKIKSLHNAGAPIHALSRMFKVNRRLIQFILFPERKEKNIKDREKRGGWKQYYDKNKNKESIKEHRRYKQNVLTTISK